MGPGRKRKPTALKVLEGNPGKRPLPQNEPQPMVLSPDEEPPAILSDAAHKHWPEIAGELAKVGVLTSMDRFAVFALCEVLAAYLEARDEVREKGDTTHTAAGGEVVSPWQRKMWKAQDQLLRTLCELGMTPASRSRVQVAKKPDKPNRFAALRASAKG